MLVETDIQLRLEEEEGVRVEAGRTGQVKAQEKGSPLLELAVSHPLFHMSRHLMPLWIHGLCGTLVLTGLGQPLTASGQFLLSATQWGSLQAVIDC